jgi:hypothetical protein
LSLQIFKGCQNGLKVFLFFDIFRAQFWNRVARLKNPEVMLFDVKIMLVQARLARMTSKRGKLCAGFALKAVLTTFQETRIVILIFTEQQPAASSRESEKKETLSLSRRGEKSFSFRVF